MPTVIVIALFHILTLYINSRKLDELVICVDSQYGFNLELHKANN